jgi:hypothetical protein
MGFDDVGVKEETLPRGVVRSRTPASFTMDNKIRKQCAHWLEIITTDNLASSVHGEPA